MSDQADFIEIGSNLVVPERSRSAPQLYDFALVLAEDAQVFAGDVERWGASLTPADAVRLFGRRLRQTARRLAPEFDLPIFQTINDG